MSNLLHLLKQYVSGRVGLDGFSDSLSSRLQIITENAPEDDLELLCDVLAGLYEVKDGMLDEIAYRQSLADLLLSLDVSQTTWWGLYSSSKGETFATSATPLTPATSSEWLDRSPVWSIEPEVASA